MADNKNFLEALAKDVQDKKKSSNDTYDNTVKNNKEEFCTDKKPDSFTTETFTRIEKKKLNISPKGLGIGLIFLVVLSAIVYFLFFAPKIEFPNFVGKSLNEFSTWANQYKIDRNGIAINKEYNFENEKDVIISQSIKEGTKIKKDTKITLVISDGPNPDENVNFPDIKNMNYDEIQNWINDNKLLKVKVTTEYSVSVEENKVISFDLKNVNENNFTRGTNLIIVVSKGPAPAGQVTVEDFTNKTFEEMRTWANNKKIVLEKQESYSDSVAIGNIISQSVKSGTAIKAGDTIIAIVSKGKAVKIPNLVGYNAKMLEVWMASPDNKLTVVKKEVYNEAPYGNVIRQSIAANSAVDQGSVLELTISLYRPVLQTNSRAWFGKDYMELIAWVDDANFKGANIAAGPWAPKQTSDDYPVPGQIIDYICADGNGNQLPGGANGCERPLPLDAKINLIVSSGPKTPKESPIPNNNTPSLPSIKMPTVAGTPFVGEKVIVVDTSPKAKVIIKDTTETEIGNGIANESGFANISIPGGLPEYIIVIAELDGEKVENRITINKK